MVHNIYDVAITPCFKFQIKCQNEILRYRGNLFGFLVFLIMYMCLARSVFSIWNLQYLLVVSGFLWVWEISVGTSNYTSATPLLIVMIMIETAYLKAVVSSSTMETSFASMPFDPSLDICHLFYDHLNFQVFVVFVLLS